MEVYHTCVAARVCSTYCIQHVRIVLIRNRTRTSLRAWTVFPALSFGRIHRECSFVFVLNRLFSWRFYSSLWFAGGRGDLSISEPQVVCGAVWQSHPECDLHRGDQSVSGIAAWHR